MADYTIIQFEYTNHRGEKAVRKVRPIRIWFGSTAWHPEAQWLLEGFDLDRKETRDYAMSNMHGGWARVGATITTMVQVKPEDNGVKSVFHPKLREIAQLNANNEKRPWLLILGETPPMGNGRKSDVPYTVAANIAQDWELKADHVERIEPR